MKIETTDIKTEMQPLHLRVSRELNGRIDDAVIRHRRRTGLRVTRAALLREWLEAELKRDESAHGEGR